MTLTDCQLLSIVAQLGTFAAAAERLHITPSAVSHAVSGVEAECGFPLFTRTKSGVTLTAAAEKLMPFCTIPIIIPATTLIKVIINPAIASPRTNFEAPSIAP